MNRESRPLDAPVVPEIIPVEAGIPNDLDSRSLPVWRMMYTVLKDGVVVGSNTYLMNSDEIAAFEYRGDI